MTDEEREKLKQLSAEDLVEMVGALRDENEKNSKKAAEERARVMREFLSGKNEDEDDGEEDAPAAGLDSPAFKKLFAKKF